MKKPTVQDIIDMAKYLETDVYGDLFAAYEEDDKQYELGFKAELKLPDQFVDDGIVLPTARNIVDTAVDHTDVANARVFVNKKKDTKGATEESEMLRKFGLGLIHRTNVESTISPWRVAAKHYWVHGMSVFKSVWDADRWPNKPKKKKGEDDKEYELRIDEWRSESHKSLPIVIQAVNPRCIMPDPSTGGELFVIERHERTVGETLMIWPNWKNTNKYDATTKVVSLSYWDNKYRCELVDEEPVLKIEGGVYEHKYGFNPYTIIESGLGNESYDAKPVKRYVGLLRYIKDLILSESRVHSLSDILIKREVLSGGTIEGPGAGAVTKIDQGYGVWQPLGEGVKLVPHEIKMPPSAVAWHLGNISDALSSHGAPPAVRGMSQEGVRSGADRRLVIAEASAKYQYSKDAFRHGTEKVLAKAALLLKNKIPDDVRVWAHTPTDELDIVIKKDKLKEPFVFFVEFAPISEEDEYRRHDDLERLYQSGIVTKEWSRGRMSNVDAAAMQKEEMKEALRPIMLQMVAQAAQGILAQKLGPMMPQTTPMPAEGGGQMMGGMTQGVQPQPPPGQEMQNQLQGMRSQSPMSATQGRGGGGSRA